ncbi:TonB-dependent receptor plug domain-containing protein, partial [Parasphingorhabdus sp.]
MKIAKFLAATALGGVVAAAPAYAQDAQGEETFDDNVIIVTATKRAQTLQETAVSVSVTTGATLETAQIRDVLDLQTVTPSLRVSQLQTSSASTFIIRGFG